jgi:glyoxylase-like metal-dependent hydrolase (beta-lactamase superfamily II)
LTHIHLDHAGAAGWLAQQGARIHVHPNGQPHLLNPAKLLASAARIYGDQMQTLWGEFLAVPERQLFVVRDQQELVIEGLRFVAVDTPGHAEHHHAYLLDDLCFSGDVGGVRLPGPEHVRIPMPPPEFHLEKWRASVQRLQKLGAARVAPTHFGIHSDAPSHFAALRQALDDVEQFMQVVLPSQSSRDEINRRFLDWTAERSRQVGLPAEFMAAYEAANPSWMSAAGMQRYWTRHRA